MTYFCVFAGLMDVQIDRPDGRPQEMTAKYNMSYGK